MNSKECVSRGCALQAAMLSPIFQVRHFDVKDLFPFKINLEWEKADGPASSTLFGAVERLDGPVPQHLPSIKGVNFAKIEPFALAASYDEGCDIGGVRAIPRLRALQTLRRHLDIVRELPCALVSAPRLWHAVC